jgi:Ala-tRNA(Pro) deacylase
LSGTIYSVRPQEKRSAEEDAVYDVLEKLEIPFERLDWTCEDEGSENVYEALGIVRLKNLLLCNAQKTKFYLLVMPASVPFKSNVLSKQLGTPRFSFAPEENLKELLHVKPGSASILGLYNDKERVVNLCIDERVLEQEYYGCHPCVNTTSLKIKTDDILNKFLEYTGHFYTVVRM